jgi:hypothetical protein
MFSPEEAVAYRELDSRINPYTCRTESIKRERLEELRKIEKWANDLPWGKLRRAYKRLITYFEGELDRHVEEAKIRDETNRLMASAPRPPR